MRKTIQTLMQKTRVLLATFLLLAAQMLAPVSAFIPTASAAPVCDADTAGANDEPGQKDLTKMCVDYADSPTSVDTSWNWDERGTSGANTLDACNLFDTDGDGFANYSVCITTSDSPAILSTITTYECTDSRVDRCQSPNDVVSSGLTDCTVSQQNDDPFPTGDFYPEDTQGSCNIDLSTVGGADAKLIDVCSYPSGSPNSDPSDCVIAQSKNVALIEVTKDVSPNGPGLFNLTVDGPGNDDTSTVNDVADGGTTGVVGITFTGNSAGVVISESAGTNTSLADFTSSVSCVSRGSSTVLFSGIGTMLEFDVEDGDDIVCTFTNALITGTIVVDKVTDPIGDSQSFNFDASGGSYTDFSLTDEAAPNSQSLAPGSYSVSETVPTGWAQTSVVCVSSIQDTESAANLELDANETITCTFTNTKQGKIITEKQTTPNGDAAIFDFNPSWSESNFSLSDGQQNDSGFLAPGDYSVDELAENGWDLTETTCISSAQDNETAADLELDAGETITCTFTNTKLGSISGYKYEVNADGEVVGPLANWTIELFVDGGVYSQNPSETTDANGYFLFDNLMPNDDYEVKEQNQTGWTQLTFDGASETCTSEVHLVDLGAGEISTNNDFCNFENGTIPGYKFNDLDGDGTKQDGEPKLPDWPFSYTYDANGDGLYNELPVNFTTDDNGNFLLEDLAPGKYQICEDPQTELGWVRTTPASSDCRVRTIDDSSETVDTAIFGNRGTVEITIKKTVVNDNGGTANAEYFDIELNGTNVPMSIESTDGYTTTYTSGVLDDFAGNFTVSELLTNDYTEGAWDCGVEADAEGRVAADFSLDTGEEMTCTITNDDIEPSLTLTKNYDDAGLGSGLTAASWHLKADGAVTDVEGDGYAASGNGFMAGTYTLSETGPTEGINSGSWSCSEGLVGTTLTVELGDDITCEITNRPKAPKLTLVKVIEGSQYGDDATVNDFGLTIGGSVYNSGEAQVLSVGGYVITEVGLPGYEFVSLTGEGCPTELGGTVMLGLGDDITCTITNKAIEPKLTIKKHVVNNNGGDFTVDDFGITLADHLLVETSLDFSDGSVDGDTTTYTATPSVETKTYSLSELATEGYDESTWSCGTENEVNPLVTSIALNLGDDITCEITNDDIAPKLTIIKKINGIESEETFDFSASEELGSFTLGHGDSKTFDDLSVGGYEVTEDSKTGWELGNVYCLGTEDWQRVWTEDDKLAGIEVDLELADNVTCKFKNDKLGEINGHKFEDVNGDGYWDEGEPTLEGWTIQLISVECQYESSRVTLNVLSDINDIAIDNDCEETVVATDITDENGAYQFENVDFGYYKVCEVQQDGWTQTAPNMYTDEYVEDGCYLIWVNESGQVEEYMDFGNFENGEVEGFKFNDANNNAAYDEGEEKLSNWTIVLTKHCVVEEEVILYDYENGTSEECEDVVTETKTDENGNYSFGNLEMGHYTVCEIQQDGWTQTYPTDKDGCRHFEIEESGQTVSADFGNKAKTPGRVLADTGTPISQGTWVGLGILVGLMGLTWFSRRRSEA